MSFRHAIRRGGALLLAAFVGAAALTTSSRAVGTIRAPNAVTASWLLPGFTTSGPVTLTWDQASMVTVMCNTTGDEAVAHVAMLRTSAGLTWSGQSGGGGGVSGGPVGISGFIIATVGALKLESNNAGSIVVVNSDSSTRQLGITIMW